MTEDLNNVIETIDDLKATNLVNAQILKKALFDINVKLEEISDGDELIFIRNSLADFKDTLDVKFQNVFENIEAMKKTTANDENSVATVELMQEKFRLLFDTFETGFGSLVAKVENIENSFSQISDENLQVSKNELEKISKEISAVQQEIILAGKNNEENMFERISVLTEGVKTATENVTSQMDVYKAYVDEKTAEIREFIRGNEENIRENNSLCVENLQEKFAELAQISDKFSDDLEIVKGSVVQLLQKSGEISQNNSGTFTQGLNSVNLVAEDILSEIRVLHDYSGNIVATLNKLDGFVRQNPNDELLNQIKELDISQNISDLFEKLVQDQFKSMFSVFDSSIKLMVTKVDDIESVFEKIAQAKLDATKDEFVKLSSELKIHQEELLETTKGYNDNTIERFSFVAESIKLLSENINIQTNMYKEFVEKKTAEIQEFVEANEEAFKAESFSLQGELNGKFKELEDANNEFVGELDVVKTSLTEILGKVEEIPVETSQAVAKEFKLVSDVANDTLSEIKILQDYSENITKVLNKIDTFTEENQNAGIIEAIKELDISKHITDMFEKIAIINNNFNVKTEFLEDQILQMKSMFSDISLNIQNKEAEILQKETQRAQEYFKKIEDVSKSLENLEESLKLSGIEYKEHITTLNNDLSEFIQEFNAIYNEVASSTQVEITNSLEELKQFLTVNSTNYNDKLILLQEQFTQAFQDLYQLLKTNNFEMLEKGLHSQGFSANSELLEEMNTKLDIIANENYQDSFDEVIENVSANKVLLQELNAKLDVFVSTGDNEFLEDELLEIKDIILEQREILNATGGPDNSFANQNIDKLLAKIDTISKTIDEHDENIGKIKEDLVHTIVSVFSGANFVEETEEIKDFVEEKTSELSQQLIDVKSQLAVIKQNDIVDYSYTLADVETDIARLRQYIGEISGGSSTAEINQISRNIHNLTSSIDSISKNLTPAEIYQLKHNILKLNEDILSISSRTNKLLLNSDESQKTISEGLLAFSHIAYNLEERMNELSNKEFNAEISAKLEKMQMMLENSASMDTTVHQVLMYLGEWVDAASNTFENIDDKANEINEVSEALSQLRKVVPEKFELINLLEERFEEQQSRLDRLESKVDELLEKTSRNNNISIIQKIDKMEILLSGLNASIEKLTSYVD